MCSLTESLCDYEFTGSWDMAIFVPKRLDASQSRTRDQ